MTAPWRKALRDVWSERGRTAAAILAIAVGVAAFQAVLSSWAILTRELNQQYAATNPASATIRTDAVGEELLRAIRSHPGVEAAEARGAVAGRIHAAGGWRNLRLFVIDDFEDIRISRLHHEAGAWPPAADEILLERDAFQVVGARIGDPVTIRTIGGPGVRFRIGGSAHDVGQAQARMENLAYGYVTADALARLGREPLLDRVLLLVSGDRFDEQRVRRIANEVAGRIEREGHPVEYVDVPTPGEHPHARIMGLLLLVMASFGFFILGLSGVIVFNLMLALMAAQVRQVGVMRALGGTRWRISRIYLVEALLLGAAGVVLAVPAGVAGMRALCLWQAKLLNFDVASWRVPLWVAALVIGVGLLVPLLSSLVPVWRGSGVSVSVALADYGVTGSSFGTGRFDRIVAATGGPARPVLLALRNALRRRGRLLLTLVALAAGGLFFLSALNVRSSMIGTLDRVFATRHYDLAVRLSELQDAGTVERIARNTPGVTGSEGWLTSEGSLARGDRGHENSAGSAGRHGVQPGGADAFPVIALPASTKLLEPQIVAGRWLEPGDTDAIVINETLALEEPEMRVGTLVPIRMGHHPTSWRVVGVVREPFHPATAYVPLAHLQRLGRIEGRVSTLRVVLDGDLDAVKTSLERNLDAEGIRAAALIGQSESRFAFDQHMLMIYGFLIVTSLGIGSVGALGLATSMSLGVLERRREIGILGTIGASPARIGALFVIEGVAIALASFALALILSWPLSRALGDHLFFHTIRTRLDFVVDPIGPPVWLAVSIAIGILATLLPARQAARLPVREALQYE